MLIDIFDKLTSGKLVKKIVFVESVLIAEPPGMTVQLAEDPGNADAWICHDENGIWLTSNAHHSDAGGYRGFRGLEEPLSSIKEIVLVGD